MQHTTANGKSKHGHFRFAGQTAPCQGYFTNELLPSVCGAEGDAVTALSQVAPRSGEHTGPGTAGARKRQAFRAPSGVACPSRDSCLRQQKKREIVEQSAAKLPHKR